MKKDDYEVSDDGRSVEDCSKPNANEWIDIMRMEPRLLETDLKGRSQAFLQPGEQLVEDGEVGTPWQSERLVLQKENPFQGLKISPTHDVNQQTSREACTKCFKSRKFFCYTCYLPVNSLKHVVPTVQLPIKIDIVKHAREVEGKSTAVHAAIIARDDVKMYIYPNIPDYTKQKALLVFPGKGSKTLPDILADVTSSTLPNLTDSLQLNDCDSATDNHAEKTTSQDGKSTNSFGVDKSPNRTLESTTANKENQQLFPYDKIVFIDSTWNQCSGMVKHPSLVGLPRVIISSRSTIFWRYQKGKPKEYLATIEAIYYFLVDYHQIILQEAYHGEYDNILFFFKFMYEKIHELYDRSSLRAYNQQEDDSIQNESRAQNAETTTSRT